jgi:hypothetical protein
MVNSLTAATLAALPAFAVPFPPPNPDIGIAVSEPPIY